MKTDLDLLLDFQNHLYMIEVQNMKVADAIKNLQARIRKEMNEIKEEQNAKLENDR